MKRIVFLLLALSLLLVSCGDNPNEGLDEAINITIENLQGEKVTLKDLNDKPIVLNFWASWCPPCKAELGDFEEAYKEYKDKINFVMVDLVGSNNETKEKALAHIEEMGYTFPVYFDVRGEGSYYYRLESIPRTYFINSDGYIEYKVEQMISASGLEFGIQKILN